VGEVVNMESADVKAYAERQVGFHLQEFCTKHRLSHLAMMSNTQAVVEFDRVLGHLVIDLMTFAYGRASADEPAARVVEWTASFEVPATWWDAFKLHFALSWWMRWWVKRNKVKYRTLRKNFKETVTARALLPDIPVEFGKRVHYVMTGGWTPYDPQTCEYCEGKGFVSRSFCGIRG
jgi:hypothetical protein